MKNNGKSNIQIHAIMEAMKATEGTRLPQAGKKMGQYVLFILLLVGGMARCLPAQATRQQTQPALFSQTIKHNSYHANVLNKIISVELHHASIEQGLRVIAKKAGLKLVFSKNIIPSKKSVSLQNKNITLENALWELLAGTDLRFGVSSHKHLVVMKSPKGDKQTEKQIQQLEAVSGRVTDASTGEALPGVNILVKGTSSGTSTDSDGHYELSVASLQDTLVFSFVGYQTQQVPIIERTEIDVKMQSQAISGQEMVVVGYGEQQRKDLTGSIASVTAEDLKTQQKNSIDQILQGKIAGVQVTTSSSAPGGGASVHIRGSGSITSGNEPLYVIDGMPIYNDTKKVAGTGGSGNDQSGSIGPNPLALINPQEIKSVEVLKDASATAIYGSRGANGVIIITTEQGQEGETTVNLSTSLSTEHIAKRYDVLNAEQYVEMANEVAKNNNLGQLFPNPPSSYGQGTDYQDLIYKPGLKQNYQLGIQSGDDNTRYSISGNFLNNSGIITSSGFRRYSMRVNLGQDISERFSVHVNVTGSQGLYAQSSNGGLRYDSGGPSITAAEFIPVLDPFTKDGQYTDQTTALPYGTRPIENPLSYVRERTDNTDISRFLGNLNLEYDLFSNLTLTVSGGADIQDLSRERFRSKRLILVTKNGIAQKWQQNQQHLLNQELLHYKQSFGGLHDLKVLGGFTWEHKVNTSSYLASSNFINESTALDNIGSGSPQGGPNISSNKYEWTILSGLTRVNYDYNDKYLLTLSGRADGSSKFGEGNKWGFFPSGAFAWRVSNESFMQGLSFLSNLKVRASYGITGNQEIGTYQSLAHLGVVSYGFGGGTKLSGYIPVSGGNPNLRWETTRQLDFGLNVGFFSHQSLRITADYYRKNTTHLILPVTLPYSSGFSSAIQNTGSVLNAGFELGIEGDVLVKDFSWTTNLNFSTNHNEVTDLGKSSRIYGSASPGLNQVVGSVVDEGEPVGYFYAWKTNGIINTKEEHNKLGYGELGGPRIVDINGDMQITEDDFTKVGDPYPDFIYGWSNHFSYRHMGLSFAFQGSYGNDIWNNNNNQLEFNELRLNSTVRRFKRRWTPENKRDATFPKPGWNLAEKHSIDFLVEDASYVRLKNLRLEYNLSANNVKWLQQHGVKNILFYIQGENLFTITNYSGLNPDINGLGQGSINLGYDNGVYPLMRIYTIGLNFKF